MAVTSNFALRVPPSLMAELKEMASRDDTSVNQLILLAIAEKIAVLRQRVAAEATAEHFAARRARAVPGRLRERLAKAGNEPPREGDELE